MPTDAIYLGVDIGGTKLAVNGLNAHRRPISPQWIEVPAYSSKGPDQTVAQIVVGVETFLEKSALSIDRVKAIGLDSPGPADIHGRIEKSANMASAWEGFQLRDAAAAALSLAAGRPVAVTYENDANAAALWESHVGDPGGGEVMALLAPGTGLGGGIVVNGRLLRGARGMGGELGHIEIVHEPFIDGWQPACGCGQKYCAEAYASMAALGKILRIALASPKYASHTLNALNGADEEETWKKRAYQVRGLAVAGDELCQSIFDWQAQAIGKLCRQIADTIDPSRFVIGGGFIEGSEALTARIMTIIRDTFRQFAFKKHAAEIKFEVARAADQAGCLGAALSAWQANNA